MPGGLLDPCPCFLWVLGILNSFKGPRPRLSHGPFSVAWIFDDVFLHVILHPFFYRFLVQLGSNLAPNLAPKSTKNRSKSRPNSNLTCILFSIAFGIDFGRNFHRFSTPKSTKNQSKFNKKSTQHHNNQKTKKFIITRQGRWIRAFGHVMLATKMYKNPYNNPQKTGLKSTPQLGSILWPTWPHFGRVWGVKMEPSWHQIASKMTLQIYPKNDHILNRSWDQFWSILGSNLAPKRGPKKSFFDVFLALEPILGPRWPQDPPRALQITILIDFWTNFNRFLNQFYQILC